MSSSADMDGDSPSSVAVMLDYRFYPHLVDLVFDHSVALASEGDRSLLLSWRAVGRHWSERADSALFKHLAISSCGSGFQNFRPVIFAPHPTDAYKVLSLPMMHSALLPASPWDKEWQANRERLRSRLRYARVVDYLSPTEFSQRTLPFTEALDADLLIDLTGVRVVRRPWPSWFVVNADVTVDVLELSSKLGGNAPYGTVYSVAGGQGPYVDGRESSVNAVLVVHIKRSWITESLEELKLECGAYADQRVQTVTVIFKVEEEEDGEDEEYERGDEETTQPRLAYFMESLWWTHKPLVFVGLEAADPRAFGLEPGTNVVAAVQENLSALANLHPADRLTQATFISKDEYRQQVGEETYELYTSIERKTDTARPDPPFQREPEDTVCRLVTQSLWKPGASKEDRAAVLAMRAVSKRWSWDVDSVLFRHVVMGTRDESNMPSEEERMEYAYRLNALMGSDDESERYESEPEVEEGAEPGGEDGDMSDGIGQSDVIEVEGTQVVANDEGTQEDHSGSEGGSASGEPMEVEGGDDTSPPPGRPNQHEEESDWEIEELARLFPMEKKAARLSLVSPGGRLPLLFEFWSVQPTAAGVRAHAKSMVLLVHTRFMDLAVKEEDVQWDLVERLIHPFTAPLVRVVRHTSDSCDVTPRTAAGLYVHVCDGTLAAPIRAQSAPMCQSMVQSVPEVWIGAGSLPSITLNVLYDSSWPEVLRQTTYSGEHWGHCSTNSINLMFTPVGTPRAALLSSTKPSEPESLTGAENPRAMGFFGEFWSTFIGDRTPVSISIIGLQDVPLAALGLRPDVTFEQIKEMVCWNLIGAITMCDGFDPELLPEAIDGMMDRTLGAIKFYSLDEYRRHFGKDGWEEIELERSARPPYWPTKA
ncbi:hypothetical protein A1Q2_01550 [Trichosporon asahii var. asahii CBS 8904]|uniref:Uncharacterized protein n=1 Tax=Trichosporon asahii var. asahii (strain CBS 8904) TaxID=1220162 RepID=K1VIZ4_TRIAC|nr:hypothetical protein A1Q2_01550 [Trichosporon asahii var. asahii CBS 8904]